MYSINHDLVADAINVTCRLRIADKLPQRLDIHDHAATLIALQDGELNSADINLDMKERALGRYMGLVIGDPDYPEDEKAPVGSKLPPLYLSPLLHLERAQRQRGMPLGNRPLPMLNLPKAVDELELYLHEAMCGVFRDDKLKVGGPFGESSTTVAVVEKARFEKTTGVTIRSLAEFLFSIRTTHPSLFLLLLSFEIEEACRTMRCLKYEGGRNEASVWREAYFKKAKCSILAIFEIIRILRRGTAIMDKLSADLRFTVSEIRKVAARLRKGVRMSADRAMLEKMAFSTYGLRKIVLNDIDRHDAVRGQTSTSQFRRHASDSRTHISMVTCFAGRDTDYAADFANDFIGNTVMNLPSAGPPKAVAPKHSSIEVARVGGAGKNQNDQLGTFYGLTGRDVAILVAIEVGRVIGKNTSIRSVAELASALVDVLWNGDKEVRSDQVGPVKRKAPHVFPAKGCFRHSCGFDRTSWSDLDGDARHWRLIAAGRKAPDEYGELFLATRQYLQGFSYGVARLAKLDDAARIFCHLSHAMGPLSQDPVWIRLLDRAKFIAGINAKNIPVRNDRVKMFGPGPKSFEQLACAIA